MVLSVDALRFTYPGTTAPALDDVSFQIAEGEVFGFLGPNGSGKSTTQKILTGILKGHQGQIRAFGMPVEEQGAAYHEHIGVSFEIPNVYDKLTATENLALFRSFYGVPCDSPEALLRALDLPPDDRRPVAQYSKGMKMRVVLARSLLNRPRLWLLDEPTTGQDPEHAVRIRQLIRERADRGVTVFLTTHDMSVADALCDRVAFLVEGHIVEIGEPRALKLAHASREVEVEVAQPGVGRARHRFDLDDATSRRAFLALVECERIETIHTQEPSLEDVFLRVTGRGLGHGG